MRKFSFSTLSKKMPTVAVRRRNTQTSTSTDHDTVGQEFDGRTYPVSDTEGLKREMSPRDLNMIAFSGSVGTGLVIGAGTSLRNGGPGPLLISFLIVGFVVWSVITTLGEMAAMCPMKKGFAGYATRFVDPCLGFATGWNYFFKYVILLPTNLTASGLIIQYWRPNLNVAIFVTVFGIGIIVLNLFHVSTYGHAQYYLGWAKIAIVATMICACIATSAGAGPRHEKIGFHYWSDAFREHKGQHDSLGRFLAFWSIMVQACFAYTGAEIVGASFGEVQNPQKNIPKAIKLTAFRILSIYILAVFVITLSVSPDSKLLLDAGGGGGHFGGASPFVIAVKEAGIRVLPDIFNAGLLVFVLSAANADIYTASRTLYGLSHDGQAPKIFGRTNLKGVPLPAVGASSLFLALGYMNATNSASRVFRYFVAVSTVFGVLNWINILLAYFEMVRAMRAQGISRKQLPYRCFCQPYSGIFALAVTVLVVLFNGYESFLGGFKTDDFITHYIGVFVYLFLNATWKLYKGTKGVDPTEASFSPIDEEGTGLPFTEPITIPHAPSQVQGVQTETTSEDFLEKDER